MDSGGELPFTGFGSAVLTGTAVVMTAVGGLMVAAAGPIAAGAGVFAGIVTKLGLRNGKH